MDSDGTTATIADEVNELVDTSEDGSQTIQKKLGKVPKRVHKSKREKMKREHLNDLFLELANALGHSELSNGKVSILTETNRLVKEMYAQIDILIKEHESLLSESQYVLIEKNDLKDENSVLESEVKRLRIELQERQIRSEPNSNASTSLHQAPFTSPLYVIRVCPDLSTYTEQEATQLPTPTVSKPRARYPTPSDSWPSQLLTK